MKNVMKKAWEIAREGQKKFGGKKHKSWVAKITGTHPKWKLNREFVDAVEENDWTGKVFELKAGIYEVCNAGDREFIQVENGEIEYIE